MALLFDDLAGASELVASTSKRNAKVAALAAVLRRLEPGEAAPAVAFLTGSMPGGRIGVGWATLAERHGSTPATVRDARPSLEVADTLATIAAHDGQRARPATATSCLSFAARPGDRARAAVCSPASSAASCARVRSTA